MKPGTTTRKGSWNSWLIGFEVGERRYVETTFKDYPAAMRTINTPKSRRFGLIKDRNFTVNLFTAVSASSAGDIRYLICVTRES